MTTGADIGDGRYPRRRRRVIAMTRGAGGGTEVPALNQRAVMDAFAIAGKLVRGDLVAAHVAGVSMTARAGAGYVCRMHFGLGVAGRAQIVHAVTVHAYCNLCVPGSQTGSVNAGFVLAQLVSPQAGIELAHVSRIRVTGSAQLRHLLAVNFSFKSRFGAHRLFRFVGVGVATMTAHASKPLLGVNIVAEFFLAHSQLVGQYGM